MESNKAEQPNLMDLPEGFRMTQKQSEVWRWAASHGLTLLADDCNDLLWRLEEINQTAKNAVDMIEDMYSMEIAEPEIWEAIRDGLGMSVKRKKK